MSVGQVLLILWRRSWIALLALATALAVAVAVLMLIPGRYDGVATAAIDSGDPLSEEGGRSGSGAMLIQGTLMELVASHRVAVDVVKQLKLYADPGMQAQFRSSSSLGQGSIEDWIADTISKNVKPDIPFGTNMLEIRYRASDPNQAAVLANAYLSATIDATIAMKASSAEQTAKWFAPQIENLRKEFQAARTALETFQAQANLVAPGASDTEGSALSAVSGELTGQRAALTSLKNRLESENTNLSSDPSDPDLVLLNSLRDRLIALQGEIDTTRTQLGASNPKVVMGVASVATLKKQIADATLRVRQHLKERITSVETQIAKLEKQQDQAQKTLIAAQAQRNKFGELQRDAAFRLELLNERERAMESAKLRSKLTFADIAVLDKAAPAGAPSFPKPFIVVPVAAAAGLALGIVLALMAEMLDRRVRFPNDLEYAASAPVLGVLEATKRRLPRRGPAWRLRAT